VITGSSRLLGSQAAIYFGALGFDVVGIDNDMRGVFFGADASTDWNRAQVQETLRKSYADHLDLRP
jgi:CDP-paratose 2-epimerase